MLDTVNDPVIFITENNIAVFAHQLDDQPLFSQVAELVQMLDRKADDAL